MSRTPKQEINEIAILIPRLEPYAIVCPTSYIQAVTRASGVTKGTLTDITIKDLFVGSAKLKVIIDDTKDSPVVLYRIEKGFLDNLYPKI